MTDQVFDDVATELAMAILQFFSSEHCEEHIFRCMKGLVRFAYIAHSEVPALIKMIGPDPTQFKGLKKKWFPPSLHSLRAVADSSRWFERGFGNFLQGSARDSCPVSLWWSCRRLFRAVSRILVPSRGSLPSFSLWLICLIVCLVDCLGNLFRVLRGNLMILSAFVVAIENIAEDS